MLRDREREREAERGDIERRGERERDWPRESGVRERVSDRPREDLGGRESDLEDGIMSDRLW